MNPTLFSTAKSLLNRVKNDNRLSSWHADCLRALLDTVEKYTVDETDNADEVCNEQIRLLISNLNLILLSDCTNKAIEVDCRVRNVIVSFDPPLSNSQSNVDDSDTSDDDNLSDVIIVETVMDADDGSPCGDNALDNNNDADIIVAYQEFIPGLLDGDDDQLPCLDRPPWLIIILTPLFCKQQNMEEKRINGATRRGKFK